MTRHLCMVAGCGNLASVPCERPNCIHKQIRQGTVADISDDELLRRAVTKARKRLRNAEPHWRWVAVMDLFGVGSTYAAQLCRRFGLDPDEVVRC